MNPLKSATFGVMMSRFSQFFAGVLCGCALISACGGSSGSDAIEDSAPEAEVAVVLAEASECWGFDAAKRVLQSEFMPDEILHWAFDPGAGTLELHHAGLVLNCCGVRSVAAAFESGVVMVTEIDQPDSLGRCRCKCPFDFKVTMTGMKSGIIGIRIMLTVDYDAAEHWVGEADLSEENGVMIITDRLQVLAY